MGPGALLSTGIHLRQCRFANGRPGSRAGELRYRTANDTGQVE
jgi:hypothetical protein